MKRKELELHHNGRCVSDEVTRVMLGCEPQHRRITRVSASARVE